MQIFVRRLTRWAYSKQTFIGRLREKRLRAMIDRTKVPAKGRIIDLGGSPYMWSLLDHDFDVVLVNLPGSISPSQEHTRFTLVEADACNLKGLFDDYSFDLVFSNSVIEHVGDETRQQDFAREVRRLAPAYWVQTPSDRCPIEAHTGFPYFWRLPDSVRNHLRARWRRQLPRWSEMLDGTVVLSRQRMKELFPDGNVFLERVVGVEKSYAMYRVFS